jgi:hypothetical protein
VAAGKIWKLMGTVRQCFIQSTSNEHSVRLKTGWLCTVCEEHVTGLFLVSKIENTSHNANSLVLIKMGNVFRIQAVLS